MELKGGKWLLLFPSELVLSHKWFTHWRSPQTPGMCSQVLPPFCMHPTSSPSQHVDRSHGHPDRAGRYCNTSGDPGSVWKPADLMCTTHTPSCCRTDEATSKENLQSCFLKGMMNVVFFLFLPEYENSIFQVT